MDFFKNSDEIDFNEFVIDFNSLSLDTPEKEKHEREIYEKEKHEKEKHEREKHERETLRLHQEIIVVGIKNSKYNCYKGYIGYIKHIREDTVTVCLDAILDKGDFILPKEHVRKFDNSVLNDF